MPACRGLHDVSPYKRKFHSYTSSILNKSHPTNCIIILCICVPCRSASTRGAAA